VLWDERDPETSVRVEQVWFAGAHSNVGGGYPQQGMSLVALDWMMKQAEARGLRFVAHVRDQYSTQHSFADKLYDPRSGLGMFYRWKPRDVTALCRAAGIRVPAIHVSAIERLIQAPEGYAPGNIPPHARLVATEDDPLVRLSEVADAIADAHGSRDAAPLLRHQRKWLAVGVQAYAIFIGGAVTALARTLQVMLTPLPDSTDALLGSLSSVVTTFPFGLAGALGKDQIALWSLVTGLAAGYGLSSWSAREIARNYSGFWHKHRPALRTALRRTPPPAVPQWAQDGRQLSV
jgi:hypothetical protein